MYPNFVVLQSAGLLIKFVLESAEIYDPFGSDNTAYGRTRLTSEFTGKKP